VENHVTGDAGWSSKILGIAKMVTITSMATATVVRVVLIAIVTL
jgi:hypothetical protein